MPDARATLENMRVAPSAFWLDVKRKVQRTNTSGTDTNHAHGILADARARGGKHVVFMVYDLPNRDCHAKVSQPRYRSGAQPCSAMRCCSRHGTRRKGPIVHAGHRRVSL
jgi:hypothetical protein